MPPWPLQEALLLRWVSGFLCWVGAVGRASPGRGRAGVSSLWNSGAVLGWHTGWGSAQLNALGDTRPCGQLAAGVGAAEKQQPSRPACALRVGPREAPGVHASSQRVRRLREVAALAAPFYRRAS